MKANSDASSPRLRKINFEQPGANVDVVNAARLRIASDGSVITIHHADHPKGVQEGVSATSPRPSELGNVGHRIAENSMLSTSQRMASDHDVTRTSNYSLPRFSRCVNPRKIGLQALIGTVLRLHPRLSLSTVSLVERTMHSRMMPVSKELESSQLFRFLEADL